MRERPTSRSPLSGRSTSADVARLAGVSQSAVSRVFTDGASASAKTSAKVKEAAEQLGTDQTDWPVLADRQILYGWTGSGLSG